MARLFFSAPDGEDGTQINVQSVGQGATRQLASLITPSDLPPGAVLPPGDFEGQLPFWDGAAWVPVPTGIGPVVRTDGFTSVEPSPTSINLGFGGVSVVGTFAQLNDNLAQASVLATTDRFQASYFAGIGPLTQITGDAAGLVFTAGDVEKFRADIFGISFFGAAAVPTQSVSGTTLQEQVNSIVASLVNFGLFNDDRTPVAAQSQLGWAPTVAGQTSNLLTLMPADHAPGLYQVSINQRVTTTSTASFGQETVTWSNGGAQTISTLSNAFGTPQWTVAGLALNNSSGSAVRTQIPRFIRSDGISPITAQVTAGGVLVAPVLDIIASAFCIGT